MENSPASAIMFPGMEHDQFKTGDLTNTRRDNIGIDDKMYVYKAVEEAQQV